MVVQVAVRLLLVELPVEVEVCEEAEAVANGCQSVSIPQRDTRDWAQRHLPLNPCIHLLPQFPIHAVSLWTTLLSRQ
jgi:hypothetical protein